jgi:hypothetical protein
MIHEWHGARGTMPQGVFVTESDLPGESLGPIVASIGLQNANLDQLKDRLAREGKRRGANAVVKITYGQQKHGALKLLNPFRWDTESWHGTGEAKRVLS